MIVLMLQLDFRIPRRDWNSQFCLWCLSGLFLILEYLGGIETRIIMNPKLLRRMILEYLGGIETEIKDMSKFVKELILEYLGGIETWE